MAKADTSVKWFHSGMADAPTLSGTAGAMLGVLDACLINGFSTRTPDSIVVSAGVATVSISAGNPYEKHAVIVISGASDAALNAEWRIATAGASSFTFLCPGVADGTVSGATVKRAGAGWGKPFSGTNLAFYTSLAPNSLGLYFRVDDNNATSAKVRGCGSVTDASTYSDVFPTVAQVSDSNLSIRKSNLADASAREWVVVADGLFFYVFVAFHSNTSFRWHGAHWFGDFIPLTDASTGHCAIAMDCIESPSWPGHFSSASMSGYGDYSFAYRGAAPGGIPGVTQNNIAPSKVATRSFPLTQYSSYPPGATPNSIPYPHPNNRVEYYRPIHLGDESSFDFASSRIGVRGILPGMAYPAQNSLPYEVVSNYRKPLLVNGYGDDIGRAFLALYVGGVASSYAGSNLIDITGPWR